MDTISKEYKREADSWKTKVLTFLRIKNELVREMMAECLGVFILMVFGNGSVAQSVLSREAAGTTISINWAYGLGVAMAIYVTGRVSGAHINPAVSLAFAVFGKLPLYKLPCYIFAQIFGGFLSGAAVYSVYYDALNAFDGGTRQVLGQNGTGAIFSTYPQDYLSITGGLWDQVFGTALLVGVVFAITDARNNTIVNGLQPLLIGLLVFTIGLSYGYNCGYAINPARDFGPRLFTAMAGWGTKVFTEPNGMYWWWVPIVGPSIGAVFGALMYNLLVGLHLTDGETVIEPGKESKNEEAKKLVANDGAATSPDSPLTKL